MTARALLLASVMAMAGVPAHAELADADRDAAANDIVVTAQRSADVAFKERQAAPNLINIQSAETIAKYPDVNAAEALGRIPGVALSIDTSEGRFVNIRGSTAT
jgi:outer membrane receptor for ferrienterochelin and colicin